MVKLQANISRLQRKITTNNQEGNLAGSLIALFTTAYPQHETDNPIRHKASRKQRYVIDLLEHWYYLLLF